MEFRFAGFGLPPIVWKRDLVPKHGIEIDFIRISGLRGKGLKAPLLAPVRIFNAWRQARAIMKRSSRMLCWDGWLRFRPWRSGGLVAGYPGGAA